jgi:hypothetical protein
MRGYASWTVALGLALTCVACSQGGNNSSGLTPMVITPPASTETFTGTVIVGGNAVHPFTVTAGGEIRVTLTAAGPPSTIVMGLGRGATSRSSGSSWDCQRSTNRCSATVTTSSTPASVSAAGSRISC